MIKYKYLVDIIDRNKNGYRVETVAEMFTEATLKALNKCKLANFDAISVNILCLGEFKND